MNELFKKLMDMKVGEGRLVGDDYAIRVPGGKELIDSLDELIRFKIIHHCSNGYDRETSAIRALIESMPESGDVEAGPREEKPSLCKPTPPTTGGSTPSSGSMTDEETIRFFDEMSACGPCNHYDECADYQKEHSGKKICEASLAYLRARLSQKPKVTREQVERLSDYLNSNGRCLSLTSVILGILGLEVEKEKS